MPISLNPESYKNIFPGRVSYSKLLPAQGDATREVWNVHIDILHDENGKWVKTAATQPCGIQNCQDMFWHRHNFLYENQRPNSPIAQFIFALKEKGGLILTEATELEEKEFQWEEVTVKGGKNPQTGAMGKDRTYYYVAGQIGAELNEEIEPLETSLPFTPPATNGVGPTNLFQELAAMSDGKNIDQVRVEARGNAAMFDNKAFWIGILNGAAFKQMQEMNPPLIVVDSENIFHKV